jgi:sodium-dependent dicarboxylate transporter 2/3/5
MTQREDLPAAAWGTRRRIGLVAGPLLCGLVLALPAPAGLTVDAWRTAAVGVLMAVWWVTEAIPIPATALLPLALFPLLGAATIDDAAAPYANPLLFLFLGGFLLALAVERWGLHRRLALSVIARIGTRPKRLLAGFMASAGLISMWVSNTATTLMLLPIGLSVVDWLAPEGAASEPVGGPGAAPADTRRFATMLMLGIAYGASIGGLGTLIGSPPNALVAAFLSETYDVEVGFVEWMAVGIPIVVVALPIAYLVLVRLHPIEGGSSIAPERIAAELAALGPMSRAEKRVAAVFTLTALAWVTRPILERWVPGLSDAGIAITGALVLFVIPAGGERGAFVLDWGTALRVPWGVLILFGGGLSLAATIEGTGLAGWLGASMGGLGGWPWIAILVAIAVVVVLFSELASNTATAAAFLPIVGALALQLGSEPILLAIPTGLAASGGFMLPVATAPNAIAYGTGAITMGQMARAGVLLDVAFVVLVAAAGYLLVPLIFG